MAGGKENQPDDDIRKQSDNPLHPFHIPFFSEPKKRSWSELVGFSTEEAVQKIKDEMPTAQVQVIPPNSAFTMEYNPQRVRIFGNASGRVYKPPSIG